nr:MAG TPA: hypothetical protein [Caudoviricetes sp.]
MQEKKGCPIVANLRLAIETTKVIAEYLKDPKATVQNEISKIAYGKNILPEEKLRNLEKGLNSNLTNSIAASLGKKELADILNFYIEEIKKHFHSKFIKLQTNSKILNNVLSTLDENYNNGVVETRWMAINSSQLYRNVFLQKLERDFEPSLRGIEYRIDFNIDTKKLLIIMKSTIAKLLEKDNVSKLSNINSEVNKLLDLTKDLDHMQVIVPKDALEDDKTIEKSIEFNINVPILNKEGTGKLLRELALETKDIDSGVEILPAIESLRDPIAKYFNKVTADVNVVTDILNNGYVAVVDETLPRIQDAISKITTEYIEMHTTDEEFISRVTNYINVMIRIIDLENYTTGLAYEVTTEVSKDFSTYLALYNLYNLILLYGVTPAKEPKLNREQ